MRIRTRSLIILVSQGLSQATTVVLGVILVRLVSQKDLGTFRQVFLIYTFLAGMIAVNLDSSLYYFLPKAGGQRERSLLFQTFLLSILFAALIAVTMLLGARMLSGVMHNPDLVGLLRIFSLYPFLERLMNLVPAFMIIRDRAVRAGVYMVLHTAGRIAVVVVTIVSGFALPGAFWAIVLYQTLVTVIGCADMMRLSSRGDWRLDRDLIRQQMRYVWPLWITASLGIVHSQLGPLLISFFYDPEIYAIYSCGAIELPVLALIATSVSSAMMPNLVALAEQGKATDALRLWHEGSRKCSLVVFPCFAFILPISWDLILLMYGPEYSMATWPFVILLFRLPLRIAVYATIFRAFGRTAPIAVAASIGLVTNLAFSIGIIWLGRGGLLSFIGPSIGATLSSFVVVTYYVVELRRATGSPLSTVMRWKELGRMLGLCLCCSLVMILIPLPGVHLVVKLTFRAVIFCLLFMVSMTLTGMLTKDEQDMIFLPLTMLKKIAHTAQL